MRDWKKIGTALIALSLINMTSVFGFGRKAVSQDCCETGPRAYETYNYYNPQYYDLNCGDNGFFVDAELLVWYARETNIDIGNSYQYINQPLSSLDGAAVIQQNAYPAKHYYLGTKWDPGFRVGFGWNTQHDGWDLYTNYTYYNNNSHKSVSKPVSYASTAAAVAQFAIGNEPSLIDPWASSLDNPATPIEVVGGTIIPTSFSPVIVTKLDGKWSFNLNQIDVELGRKYWVSRKVNLRPYLGVRTALTYTTLNVESRLHIGGAGFIPTTPGVSLTTSRHYRNKIRHSFWGVGLLGGVQPEFRICRNIALFGNVDGALLWGQYNAKNEYRAHVRNQTSTGVVATRIDRPVERDNFARMQGIMDLSLGLRWEEHWYDSRYSTTVDLGWEHHYWFDFGMYHRDNGSDQQTGFAATGTVQNFQRSGNLNTNLGFGGLVLRARFDF
jgi:hypothetical protein